MTISDTVAGYWCWNFVGSVYT